MPWLSWFGELADGETTTVQTQNLAKWNDCSTTKIGVVTVTFGNHSSTDDGKRRSGSGYDDFCERSGLSPRGWAHWVQ